MTVSPGITASRSLPGELLLDRLAALPPATDHPPAWRIVERDRFLLIYDGEMPVAVFDTKELRWDIREFYPDGRNHSTDEILLPYHKPSFHGTILSGCWWSMQQCAFSERHTVTARVCEQTVILRVEEDYGDGQTGSHTFRLTYSPRTGGYCLDAEAHLALVHIQRVEVVNLYTVGVGTPWADEVTCDHTLFTGGDGALRYFWHNPLMPCTPGALDVIGRKMPVGGFYTFGTRTNSNPVVELLACHTTASYCATCTAYYDEHLFMGTPAGLGADGMWHWDVQYRVSALEAATADALLRQATPLPLGVCREADDDPAYLITQPLHGRHLQSLTETLPFALELVNDCAQALDPATRFIGCYWAHIPQPHGNIIWDRAVGHACAGSLRLHGRTSSAHIVADTYGPIINTKPGYAYTFSAWVKVDGAAEAWIQLETFTFGRSDGKEPTQSTSARKADGWQYLAITVTTAPDTSYLAVSLHLHGEGTAWFDEMALMRKELA